MTYSSVVSRSGGSSRCLRTSSRQVSTDEEKAESSDSRSNHERASSSDSIDDEEREDDSADELKIGGTRSSRDCTTLASHSSIL